MISCTAWPGNATAAWPIIPEMERPMISALQQGDFDLWGQYDYLSSGLDVLNYAGKLNSSTKLDSFQNIRLGLKYAAIERLTLSYRYLSSDQNVTRLLEPKNINSRLTGHDARLQYTFYRSDKLQVAAEAGFRSHHARQLDFHRFDASVGGTPISVASVPGQPPVFSLTAADRSWLGAIRGATVLGRHLRLDVGIELRRNVVRANLTSVNLADPVIGPALLNEAPQNAPWKEQQAMLQMGMTWAPVRWLGLSADYTYYRIRRSGYIPKAGKLDYNTNHQVDAYIFWHVNEKFSIYGHGRATNRFILGEMPLAYNTRVNHRFKDMFGYLSAGASWRF